MSTDPLFVPSAVASASAFAAHSEEKLLGSLDRFEALWRRLQGRATAGLSSEDLLKNCLEEMSALFPSSLVAVFQVERGLQTILLEHCYPVESRDAWQAEARQAADAGKFTSALQYEHALSYASDALRVHYPGHQSVILTPLVSLGELHGLICVATLCAHVSPLDVKMVAVLARPLAFALYYARREETLKQEKTALEEAVRQRTREIERTTNTILRLNSELEAELRKALEVNDRLSLADRIRESLLATVSHELRTPLSAILGSLELFREEWNDRLPLEARRMIDICERNSAALLALISDLLDVASLRSSPPSFFRQTISLRALVQETLDTVLPLARANEVRLDNIVPSDMEVYADVHRLRQVLLHLQGNAVKFCGQESPYVHVRAALDGEMVVVRVQDNGVGIAPERVGHIFEPFTQGEDSYTSPTKGAGLGLSICKLIIEHHGGSLWVESELGKGSCFSFTLPQPPLEV